MRRALLVATFLSSAVFADAKHPNPFLSQAKVFATQGEGDKCLKRLIQAEQKWKYNDKKDRAEIEMYGGVCGYLVGETQAAEVSFKNAVKIDPKVELPKELGPGVEQLWAKATGKSVPLASSSPGPEPKKKDEPLKKPESQKVVEAKKDEPPPPPVAPVLQNDRPASDRKKELTPDEKMERDLVAEANAPPPKKKGRNVAVPVVLALLGVGAGGAGAGLGLMAKGDAAKFKSLDTKYADAMRFGPQAQTEALGANIAFVGAGVLVAVAVVVLLVSGD